MSEPIVLRPYQVEAIKKTALAVKKNETNKFIWVVATGAGKTVMFSELASRIIKRRQKKILILAHREELLRQAKNKILDANPDLDVGIEQAESSVDAENNHDVIIASVPTLGREGSLRIQKFDPKEFGLVIIDEAHHSSAKSYMNILRYFGLLKPQPTEDEDQGYRAQQVGPEPEENTDWNRSCILLGVTATPSRTDNKGINLIFDEIVFEYHLITGIKENFLAPIHAYRIKTAIDLSDVKKTAGDFNLSQLEEKTNVRDRNELVVKAYQELTPGKQALVFAGGVDHALELEKTFNAAGITASSIFGTTDGDTRTERLKAFLDKKIKIMVNFGVLTEGVDIPSIDVVLMARPTISGILYNQMLGRGCRLYPGKEYLTIIDFVDNTKRQKLITVASLLGKPNAIDFQGMDILSAQQDLDDLQEVAPGLDLEEVDVTKIKELIEKAKLNIEEVDLIGAVRKEPPLAAYSTYEWQKYNEDSYKLSLGTEKDTGIKYSFFIEESLIGKFLVKRHTYDSNEKKGMGTVDIGTYKNLATAVTEADKYIQANHSSVLGLISSDAKWRKDKPTDPQREWLRKFNVADAVIAKMTKGDATRALSRFFASKKRPNFNASNSSPKPKQTKLNI